MAGKAAGEKGGRGRGAPGNLCSVCHSGAGCLPWGSAPLRDGAGGGLLLRTETHEAEVLGLAADAHKLGRALYSIAAQSAGSQGGLRSGRQCQTCTLDRVS